MGTHQRDITWNRIFTESISAPEATPDSIATASISERGSGGNPIMGDATMKIYNVSPQAGAVIVRGEIDWDSPLRVRISVVVID